MDDDVTAIFDKIAELLPPRTTEYRSSAAPIQERSFSEPTTEPIRIPAGPIPATPLSTS